MIEFLIGYAIISAIVVLIQYWMIYNQRKEIRRLYIEESRRNPSKEVRELKEQLDKYMNK